MYTYIPFLLSLPPNPSRPFRSSQSAELSSLCHTVASHWLSNLHMVVWVGEIPWRWKCQPAQVLLPGESHVQRSLVGYSPWDRKRAGHDLTTEQQQLSVYISMLLSIHPPASLLCPQVFSLAGKDSELGGEAKKKDGATGRPSPTLPGDPGITLRQ